VLEGVRVGGTSGSAQMALADDGTLVYIPGLPVSRERHLAWLEADGRRTLFEGPARHFREPRVDPTGRRVALREGPTDTAEVWVHGAGGGSQTQVTFGLHPWFPLWTRDGGAVTVAAESGGRWRILSLPVAGGAPRTHYESAYRLVADDWSPDGRTLLFQEWRPEGWDLWSLSVDAAGVAQGMPAPVAQTPANETGARFSPDGRWVAFEADDVDALVHVYVAPLGRWDRRISASRPAGRWPVWSGAGELMYWMPFPSQVRRVVIAPDGDGLRMVSDEVVPGTGQPNGPRTPTPPFDYDRHGRRLLFFEDPPSTDPPPAYAMTLFVGFGDEARRRLAGGR
jgi:Tol biopolymer transport system component